MTGLIFMDNAATMTAPGAALDRIFRARSVAIVGASPQRGTARNQLVQVLLKHGFAGTIFPVTPSHEEIEGFKAYKSVADLPETPDLALIITPASTVPGIIAECGQKGIAAAIVFSSGFEEIESGKDVAQRLVAAAREHNVTVLGPNCQGIWSLKANSVFSFGGAAMALESLKHAPVAIISQSGALSGAFGSQLQRNGLGCSYIVSVGNESLLDALDVLAWLIEQDDVRVVGLYLEGLKDAWRLLPLAERGRARGIQIVALKAGRSTFGQEATASHTGKIASPYAIYRDVLAQAGVVAVESLSEALAAIEALAVLPDPRPSKDPQGGIAILSSSGGAGALLADHCEEFELPMAVFGDDTIARLDVILPEFARKVNPIDLTGQVRSVPNLFGDSLAVVASDPRTEAIVVQFASSGRRDLADNAEVFKDCARRYGLPVIVSFASDTVDAQTRADFQQAGVLVSEDPYNTMRALRWAYDRQGWSSITVAKRSPDETTRRAPVSWEDTMSLLMDAEVTPAQWVVLRPGEKAAQACAHLSWPLVVKVLPSEAEHKTEMGLVKLRVRTPEEVDAHAAAFRQITGKPDMDVLVQEMITDGVEVVLSCLRNTDFGPVLSIGSGGIAIELYRDLTYLALPVTAAQVETALKRLKVWTLLQGFRGAPRTDVEALIRATVKFGNIMLSMPELAEAEINPVLVRPQGKGIAAVDFLGTISAGPAS
ncbi:acetate--CoA ligase family protein [Devosia sp. A369]